MASSATERRQSKRPLKAKAPKRSTSEPAASKSAAKSVSTTSSERFGRERMSRLGTALASDAMIIFMLSVVVVEAAALVVWHGTTTRGPEPIELLSFLGAGASLMSAMFFVKRIKRSALPFASALLSALAFHIWHMALLWGR